MKVAAPQAPAIASSWAMTPTPAPSSMIARNASLIAVNGSAWINGWTASGKRPVAKNVPEARANARH